MLKYSKTYKNYECFFVLFKFYFNSKCKFFITRRIYVTLNKKAIFL